VTIAGLLRGVQGECDREMGRRINGRGLSDAWDDLRDYCNPLIYLRRLTGYLNHMRQHPEDFSDEAHEAYLRILTLVAQRTLRQPNAEDRQHFLDAVSTEGF